MKNIIIILLLIFAVACEQKPKYTKSEANTEIDERRAKREEVDRNITWEGRASPYGNKIKVVKVKDCEYVYWADRGYFFHYEGCENMRHEK